MTGAGAQRAPFEPVGGVGWALIQIGFASTMTLGHLLDYTNPWPVVAAVFLSGAVAGVSLSARWYRTWSGKACSLLWLPLILIVGEQISPPLPELSALWPAIAALLAMGLVAMSGAPRVAWAVGGLVVAVSLLWASSRGLSGPSALEQLALLTPLVGGTVYRIAMRRARERETVAREEHAVALRRLGVLASQADARREYRARLLEQVGGLLDRIADGDKLDRADRAECRLVEAALRDGIRGRGLAVPEVARAARAARERGATVTLIDDRAPDSPGPAPRAVLTATHEALDRAGTGATCVARLLPPGRRNLATVLLVEADGDGVRREFTRDDGPAGSVRERPAVAFTG